MSGRYSRHSRNVVSHSYRGHRASQPIRAVGDGINVTMLMFGCVFAVIAIIALLVAMRIVLSWF